MLLQPSRRGPEPSSPVQVCQAGEPGTALLCPEAEGSCDGLPVPASARADQPSSTSKKT